MSARLLIGALAVALVAIPTPAAAATTSTVYVTDFQDNSVAVVNGNAVTATIPVADQGGGVGANPTQTTLSPDGSLVYVLASGPAPGQQGSITKISTATGRYVGRFRLANPAVRFVLTPDGHQMFLQDRIKITALDLGTGRATSLAAPAPVAEALSPDGRTLYVANPLAAPDGSTVYVTAGGGIVVVNVVTGTVTGTLGPRGANAGALTPNGATLYAVESGRIQAIATATNTVTATIPVTAQHVAMSPDGTHLYVLTHNSVVTVDTATNTITGTAKLGQRDWTGLAVR